MFRIVTLVLLLVFVGQAGDAPSIINWAVVATILSLILD